MIFMENFIIWIKKLTIFLIDLIVPEDQKVARLLSLDQSTLRSLLRSSPARVTNITVLFDYNHLPVRNLIKVLKYKNNQAVRRRLADFLHEELTEILSEKSLFEGSVPVLISMPMSKKERQDRGFNQCEELAKEIVKLSGNGSGESSELKVLSNALKKTRETARQTKLSRGERLLNVKNSMIADPKLVAGKNVILLDDVFTTLATFSEARRALLVASAHSVHGLFLAH